MSKSKTKRCCICKKRKAISQFYRNKSRPDGYSHFCKQCDKEKSRTYEKANRAKRTQQRVDGYANNRDREKATKLARVLRKFKLTRRQYDRLLSQQGGVCAICGCKETATRNGRVRRLCLDHNHSTGEVRGLLCTLCNSVIGSLRDDPAVLRAAAKYVEQGGTYEPDE